MSIDDGLPRELIGSPGRRRWDTDPESVEWAMESLIDDESPTRVTSYYASYASFRADGVVTETHAIYRNGVEVGWSRPRSWYNHALDAFCDRGPDCEFNDDEGEDA